MTQACLHQIAIPADDPGPGGWRPHPQFHVATRIVASMHCHYSVLGTGHSPHPPHAHVEEELLLILDGSAEILIAKHPSDPSPTVVPMTVGQFAYYPAWQHHTLRNVSDRSVTYLMFKWVNRTPRNAIRQFMSVIAPGQPVLRAGTFDVRQEMRGESQKGFAPTPVFEGRTRWLGRLHCHLTRLKAGAGYAPHADGYDVAMVLLDGSIETGNQVLERCAVAYFGAEELHGMHNPGSETATYLVFEFDGTGRKREH